MRITIPDDLADRLLTGLPSARTLDAEATRRLLLLDGCTPTESVVVLAQADLDAISTRLGLGLPLRDVAGVLTALDALAQIHLGDTRIGFTPAQLAQIQARADRAGLSLEVFFARVVSRLLTDIFQVEPVASGPIVVMETSRAGAASAGLVT